ncbi:winged helix-turn-helix domain-containing protein [Streptomyces sp. NPDC020766]|uniref:winged helix-turn-helix domain-containing protein n=1 Tax=Streptomyces sp. NPDC020766 TaxID=3155011 RepID=UPI0033EB723D
MDNALREQLANGTYRPGDMLPAQRDLASEYGVSRDTVQRVLRQLAAEDWIQSKQGSGSRVLRVPRVGPAGQRAGLGAERQGRALLLPLIHAAFEQSTVSLDVFTLTSETLVGHLRQQTERFLVTKEIPLKRLHVRMMVPWEDELLAYPRAKDPGDARVWQRWRTMTRKHLKDMEVCFKALNKGGVDARLEVRRVPLTPHCKLYVLNDTDMLYGTYDVVERTVTLDDGTDIESLDVLGLGSTLSHHRREADEESHDSTFFASHQGWFESCWNLLGVVAEGD